MASWNNLMQQSYASTDEHCRWVALARETMTHKITFMKLCMGECQMPSSYYLSVKCITDQTTSWFSASPSQKFITYYIWKTHNFWISAFIIS